MVSKAKKKACRVAGKPARAVPSIASTSSVPWNAAVGNTHDADYQKFLEQLQIDVRIRAHQLAPYIYTTDADPRRLWEDYRTSFPSKAERQHHNCTTCRQFIQRFGGLTMIDDAFRTVPLLWGSAAQSYPVMQTAFERLRRRVEKATVTGVWIPEPPYNVGPDHLQMGTPSTPPWNHMSARIPAASWLLIPNELQTPHQHMAQRRQDFETVCRAALAYRDGTFALAENWLSMPASPFEEGAKYLEPLRFLRSVRRALANKGVHASGMLLYHNQVWQLVAAAPAGFCHPSAGMLGMLLQYIQDSSIGYGGALPKIDPAVKAWNEARDPAKYLRPTAAPKAGTIEQAEKIVAQLGLGTALERRVALHSDIPPQSYLWRPSKADPIARTGVFSHLNNVKPESLSVPLRMTWAKFAREVLPDVIRIRYIPGFGVQNHIVLTGPTDPAAQKLLKWGNEFAWYVYDGGSPAAAFALRGGTAVTVPGIITRPDEWYQGTLQGTLHASKAIILLDGARELSYPGLALFPEHLRAELHGVRSVLEAHSRALKLKHPPGPQAIGVVLEEGRIGMVHLRVVDQVGHERIIVIDRWD